MKRNTASQTIGAQMVSATDGSAFTGAVTVYVTGDAGTQAAGSVGAGACAHEGNGFHTYAPAQGETDYAHIGFTFIGTGAIPGTVQVFPTFPQTGDNFARLGAPAGASVSVDIAAIKTQTAAIETDTQDLQSRVPAALVSGRIDASVGAMAANVMTAAAAAADLTTELQTGLATQTSVDDLPTNAELATALGTADDAVLAQVALVKAKTDNLPSDPADASDIATAFSALDVKVDAIDDFLDTEVAAIKAKTDLIPSDPAETSDLTQLAADAAWLRELADDTVIVGTIGSGSTTTSLVSSALSPAGAVADQFKGRIVIFDADTATAALRGQGSDITANTSAATPTFTVTALTTAPASGDTFHIV